MAGHSLPDLKITLENETEDIQKLLRIIKPTWKEDAVKIEKIVGGYSCRMFRCYNEAEPEDSVIVRVRNILDSFVGDEDGRATEMRMIEYMSRNGHFPKIHASFGNGYCYQFIPGKPVMNFRKKEISTLNEEMLALIAKELAFIHSIKFDDQECTSDKCFKFYSAVINAIPEGCSPSKETLAEELKMLRKHFESKDFRIIICHGDPNFGNIIYNEEKGTVTFIDWELAGCCYQLYEVAHVLVSLEMTEMMAAMMLQMFAKMMPENIAGMLSEKYAAMMPESLSGVTPELIAALVPEKFAGMMPETFAAMMPENTAGMTSEKFAAMMPEKLEAMMSEKFQLPKGYQRYFVRQYHEALAELEKNRQHVTEEELDKLMEEIEGFKMVFLLTLMAFPLAMKDLMKEAFDDLGDPEMFKQQSILHYLKLKEKYFGKNCFELANN